ncbi:PrsW family intramembrane metalloprotease [Nocardia sp. NPDC049526]|uniref:PrsW family intramembrane metalloprotease n=1 Tax=Nocardia sp. NPDC049526 TaxID=3364316 RepID=UPI0037929AAE
MKWWQPKSALFWVYCATLVAGAFGLAVQIAPVLSLTWSDVLVGLPFTVATLVIFGWVILHLDRLRARHRIRTPLVMGFLWGALAGPGIAMWANDHNMRVIQNLAGDPFARNWQAPISAAIVEEGIKGAGVFTVAWLSRPLLQRPMHGLLLGAFVGLGFQVIEDLTYEANSGLLSAQGDASYAVLVGIVRLITGITSHWLLTAIAGIGIVPAVARSDWSSAHRVRIFATFYLLGCALHFGWDAPDPANVPIVGTTARTICYLLVFAVVYAWVLRSERHWFTTTIARPEAMAIAPPAELHSLITRRTRRHARREMHVHGRRNRRLLERRQRMLLDAVQNLGA